MMTKASQSEKKEMRDFFCSLWGKKDDTAMVVLVKAIMKKGSVVLE